MPNTLSNSLATSPDRDSHRSPSWRVVLAGLALSIAIGLIWFAAPDLGGPEPTTKTQWPAEREFPPAPRIEGISHWVNSEPITLSDLQGSVVLLDFWTYTCVNCIRTLPWLQDWHNQYSDDGLALVGIHTPEFEFEKEFDNVLAAAQSQGVTWPVALDNDYVTWDNYLNAFWPTKYLIDAQGRLRYHRVGEGGYASFEERIRALLTEASRDLSDDPPTALRDHEPDARYAAAPDRAITRELYAGYERGKFEREYYGQGYVGQSEYYSEPDLELTLEAPEYLEPDQLYFQGVWRNGKQEAVHAAETTDFEDYVALVYSARTVNAVLSAGDGDPIKVKVLLDGEFLTEENRGADVTIDANGESYLWVNQSRMYQVVENPTYVKRSKLQLSSNSARFGVYAITFGIYAQGP